MFNNVVFFDFCRIELFKVTPVSPHSLEDINFSEKEYIPSKILNSNSNVRKLTYAAKHQNKNINKSDFSFLFSIYIDSSFKILSVDIDTKKMIDEYEKTNIDKRNQGKQASDESILSVMSRFLLRTHLSIKLIVEEIDKKLKESCIPLSLTIEKKYIHSGYAEGRIVSSIKLFFSVIDLIIDDEIRFKNFVSSLNYNNVNDIIIFINCTKLTNFEEDVSYESNDTSAMLKDAFEKVKKIGSSRLKELLIKTSMEFFSERVIDDDSTQSIMLFNTVAEEKDNC